jgi:hypothetical protein
MNPYIERPSVFHDFHQRFANVAAEQLTEQIRPKYIAQIDTDVYVQSATEADALASARPDVMMLPRKQAPSTSSTATIEAPVRAMVSMDGLKLAYVRILDRERRGGGAVYSNIWAGR